MSEDATTARSEERLRIDVVIVPLDGSVLATAALVPAVALARRIGAAVELVTTRWDDDIEHPLRYLEHKAELLGIPRVEATVDPKRGAPDAILYAAGRGASVVCMTTHGRSRLREGVFGSVAGDVLRRSTHPLLLVGPNALTRLSGFEPQNMGIAIDGSDRSASILPVAARWAELLGMRAWMLQVVEPNAELPPGSDVVESASLETLAHDAKRHGYAFDWDVLHSRDPARALVDHAKDVPLSLLALTSHGRTGTEQLALGSVALRVAHHSPCPLLVTGPQHTP